MRIEVTEIVEGELDVVAGTARCRVLVPAGVGVAGFGDDELAAAVVREWLDAGRPLPAALDVASLLRSDPALFAAVEQRLLATE
jgi:hypothetical protein